MAMTYQEFVKSANAEVVGSRIVVGRGGERKFVGTIEGGVFTLNEDGQAMQEALEAAAREKPAKAPKAPKVAPVPDATSINDDLNFSEE